MSWNSYVTRVPRILGAVLATGMLIALSACGASSGATSSSTPASPAVAPWHVVSSALRAPANTPQEMCQATLVAVATVGTLGQAHWNTPNGQRPTGLTNTQIPAQGDTIYTPVSFSAFLPLVDHRTQSTVEYDLSGGQVGTDSLLDEDAPHLKVGGRYIVVFTPSQVAGGTYTQRNLFIYDAFPIDSNDMVQLQPQLIEQGQVAQQAEFMSLSDLTTQLAVCKGS